MTNLFMLRRDYQVMKSILATWFAVVFLLFFSTTVMAAPIVTITTPTTAETYTQATDTLTLMGTATVVSGSVVQVQWSNDRGGSGIAVGTSTWTVSGISLQVGVNIITVTAMDNLGDTSSDVINVILTDTESPIIAIEEPTTLPTYTTIRQTLVVSGMAADNVEVTQVLWANNRGGAGAASTSPVFVHSASSYVSWSAIEIPLQPGDNVLTITALDAVGNSVTDIITVTYSPPDMFTLGSVYTTSLDVVVHCDPANPCDGLGNDLYIAWTGPPWSLSSNNLYGPITPESNAAMFGSWFSHTYGAGGTYCIGLMSYQGGVLTPINNCWPTASTCNSGLPTCAEVVLLGGDQVAPNNTLLYPPYPGITTTSY